MLLTATSGWAIIDHGTTGVANTTLVKNVLQITPGDPANPTANIRDWIPCWGVNPWSQDGQWIVYQSQMGGGSGNQMNEICIIKKDGTSWQRLTNNSLGDTHGNFTPDGKKIVFQREVVANMAEVWVMNSDGTNQVSLTQAHGGPVMAGGCEQKPVISPDGKKIAFRAYNNGDDETGKIWVMNIDGSNPVNVSGIHDHATKHSWSPDSQWIIFSAQIQYSVNNVSRIFKVMPTGENLTMLSEDIDDPYCENWAAWSPDGMWISYHHRTNAVADNSEIWLMKTDGTGKKVLVSAIPDTLDPEEEWVCGPHSWHPTSQWITFKRNPGGDEKPIYIANVNNGEITKLTTGYNDGRMWWSPDGISILFKEYNYSTNTRDGALYNYDLLLLNLSDTFKTTRIINISASSVNFGFVLYKSTKSQTITVTNKGNVALTLGAITVSNTDFTIANDNVSNKTIAAGASATFNVVFKPTRFGKITANINIPSDDPAHPNSTIQLEGFGFIPTNKDDKCFIATAAFGSPLAGQVEILRQFRDKYLLTNTLGQKFVIWYYQNGPIAANFIQDKPLAKVLVQTALYPLIGFSFLLINGFIMPLVLIGLLLAVLLFFWFRRSRQELI